MKDEHRFYRLVHRHGASNEDLAEIQLIRNRFRKRKKVKWKLDSSNAPDYVVEFDFKDANSSWKGPNSCNKTGGNIFGGRKEICKFVFEVAKRDAHNSFTVRIVEDGIRTKSHNGQIHLPGLGD